MSALTVVGFTNYKKDKVWGILATVEGRSLMVIFANAECIDEVTYVIIPLNDSESRVWDLTYGEDDAWVDSEFPEVWEALLPVAIEQWPYLGRVV